MRPRGLPRSGRSPGVRRIARRGAGVLRGRGPCSCVSLPCAKRRRRVRGRRVRCASGAPSDVPDATPPRDASRPCGHRRRPPMVTPDAKERGGHRAQPSHARRADRISAVRHRDDDRAVPSRRVRGPRPGSLGPVQMVFWIAFDGFFFGLTYGLLQIVGEMAVLRGSASPGSASAPT